jgi:hypothetical protein
LQLTDDRVLVVAGVADQRGLLRVSRQIERAVAALIEQQVTSGLNALVVLEPAGLAERVGVRHPPREAELTRSGVAGL